MIDDNKFENGEQFTIKLSQPDRTLIEKPDEASVTILDLEDGKLFFLLLLFLSIFPCTIIHDRKSIYSG